MSTFLKIFAIFWIVFLIWYLTGGPQRVTINKDTNPSAQFNTIDKFEGDVGNNNSTNQSQSSSIPDRNNLKEKSFSTFSKTNTINTQN